MPSIDRNTGESAQNNMLHFIILSILPKSRTRDIDLVNGLTRLVGNLAGEQELSTLEVISIELIT